MAKRYMLQCREDNAFFVYECRGMKRLENRLEIVSLHQYLYEELYKQFVEKIRMLRIDNLSQVEFEKIKGYYVTLMNALFLEEIVRADGYLITKATSLSLGTIKKLLVEHQKATSKGAFHFYNEQYRILIKRGSEINGSSFKPVEFPKYDMKVKQVYKRYMVWKEKALIQFSEWELLDLLWIATIYQEHRCTTYAPWVQKVFGDRTESIYTYNVNKMIEILYLNLVLNKHK